MQEEKTCTDAKGSCAKGKNVNAARTEGHQQRATSPPPTEKGQSKYTIETWDMSGGGERVRGGGRASEEGERELVSVLTPTRGKTQKLHPLLYA